MTPNDNREIALLLGALLLTLALFLAITWQWAEGYV
jgi:hypothetical protein